jgi:hypothetical protein
MAEQLAGAARQPHDLILVDRIDQCVSKWPLIE